MPAGKAVIVGGGHNGLVCAFYLARAGFTVTVLERRGIVGGAAVTESFHPGFRNSTASYTVSLLHPKVIEDMALTQHGLKIVARPANNYLPLGNGDSLTSYPDMARMSAEVARHSSSDAAALPSYYAQLERVVPIIRDIMLMTPPQVSPLSLGDIVPMFRLSRHFRQLDRHDQRFLVRLFTVSAVELLDEFFESDVVRTYFAFDATVGHFTSPYAPGSAYVLLHHAVGEVNGASGAWGHAIGGMGAITQAMASAAVAAGVTIVTGADVEQFTVDRGRVRTVRLHDGRSFDADIFAASVNPVLLYQQLLPADAVDEDTHHHFRHYNNGGGTFRMNVALDRLPAFSDRMPEDCLTGGIIIAPSIRYMDDAYHSARRQGYSEAPIVEMLIPSLIDDSLAPEGQHVASLFCQHFDPDLRDEWDVRRFDAAARIIDTCDAFAPGFRDSVVATQIHSPFDLEKKFGLSGGDIFHGRLSLEQLFSFRPMPGLGQYRTNLQNLFLCGAGTHPGGGVSGIPGHNAAREIIKHA